MKKVILYFLLCFFPIVMNAQLSDLESLIMEIDSFSKLNDYDAAIPLALKAVDLSEKIDSSHAKALRSLATLYIRSSNLDAAEPLLKKAIGLYKKSIGEKGEAFAELLFAYGKYYQDLGEYQDAETYIKRALKTFEDALGKNTAKYANALGALGKIYYRQGIFEESESTYLEGLEIIKKLPGEHQANYANALIGLGNLYLDLGKRYAQAEALYLEALEVRKEYYGKEHPAYAMALSSVATYYWKAHNYKKAEAYFLEAMDICLKTVKDKGNLYAVILNNLAGLYSDTGKLDKAEALHKKALELSKRKFGENHIDCAHSYLNLGMTYKYEGKFKKAEPLYLKAIEIRKNVLGESHPTYARTVNDLALLYESMGDFDRSIKTCLKAIRVVSKDKRDTSYFDDIRILKEKSFYSNDEVLFAVEGIIYANEQLYAHYKDERYLERAYAALEVAIDVVERVRKNFSVEGDSYMTLAYAHKLISNIIDKGYQLDKKEKLDALFHFAELNKSILLADVVRGKKARLLGDLPKDLIEEEKALQSAVRSLAKKESLAKTEEEKRSFLEQEASLNTQIESFKQKVKNKYPKYHRYKFEQIIPDIKTIQSTIAKKSVLLEYFVANRQVFLFCIGSDQAKIFQIPISADSLQKRTKSLRNSLTAYDALKEEPDGLFEQYTKDAHWFYKTLIAPVVEDYKEAKHLIVIADAALGYLPFETFLTDSIVSKSTYNDLPYLLKDYSISYNYSATLFKENYRSNNLSNNRKVLGFAATYKKEGENAETRSNLAPNLRQLRDVLQDLPAATLEVEGLSEIFAGKFVVGVEASEQNFKKLAGDYAVIHLAMHGLLNKKTPLLSSLVFTEQADSLEDNFLEAWEISQLQLNADLVVLSACETGYGKFRQGEGVMSLARSFMYTGTPSLVVSLWQVNDQSTSIIMQKFYAYLAAGKTKSEALRQAKLDYIEKADAIAAHPAFWSPFILIGDESPVKIQRKGGGNLLWWAVGVGAFVLAGLGLSVARRKKAA